MLPFGLILAGGRGRRMGGRDKALLKLGGQTLLDRVAARLAPQVAGLAVSSNSDPALLPGLKVLPDETPDLAGPLAGVLSGLCEARRRGFDGLVSVAVDTPFFPDDLVTRLAAAGGGLALSRSGGDLHPTFALWPVALADELSQFLAGGGRKLRDFTARHSAAVVDFPPAKPDAFFNINTPEDLRLAESLLTAHP